MLIPLAASSTKAWDVPVFAVHVISPNVTPFKNASYSPAINEYTFHVAVCPGSVKFAFNPDIVVESFANVPPLAYVPSNTGSPPKLSVALDENTTLNVSEFGFTSALDWISNVDENVANPTPNPIITINKITKIIFLFFLSFSICFLSFFLYFLLNIFSCVFLHFIPSFAFFLLYF